VKITVGYGTEGFITGDAPLVYTIYFENQASATAPAQKVVVTDQLSNNLDWSTLELVSIGFNQVEIPLPPGLTYYTGMSAVASDPNPVRVQANFDPNKGIITWVLESVDPVTQGLPEDPLAGFLPPNKDWCNHCGEGYVSFLVWPKAGLVSGEAFTNQASIVFDVNVPILTNVVTNTIDNQGPTSSVQPLAVQNLERFLVQWGGSDNVNGSGIAFYDIYVSEDGGPFELWLGATTATQALYPGRTGHTYAFYSLAYDGVGHREEAPAVADSSTITTGMQIFLPIIFR
jgi:hypothetical protein